MNFRLSTSKWRIAICVFVVFLASAGAAQSNADTLDYSLTGAISMSFSLPVNPTINSNNYDTGYGFTVTPTNLVINGTASSDFLAFYSFTDGGGFGAFSSGTSFDILTSGVQLYSGSESSPTMLGPSLLTLPALLTDYNNTLTIYALTITDVSGNIANDPAPDPPATNPLDTPEPGTDALLIVAMLFYLGLSAWRRWVDCPAS
jgi:hypothetical protein